MYSIIWRFFGEQGLLNMLQGLNVVYIMRIGTVKLRVLLLVAVLCAAVSAQNGSSLSNPNVRSPVGSGTVPVTTYRNGLITSPNPIDRTSDLVVTGNVGGGRNFQGYLPYNAISDFGGPLGSGTLDDFLRRSTIPQDYYSGGVAPFYSQTGTVTRIVPGTNMVVVPPSEKIRTERHELMLNTETGIRRSLENYNQQNYYTNLNKFENLPMETEQAEPNLSLGSEEQQAQKQRELEKYRQQQNEFTEQLRGLKKDVVELQQRLGEQSQPVKPSIKSDLQKVYEQPLDLTDKPQEPFEPELPGLPKQPFEQEKPKPEKVDVYDKMLREYEEAQKAAEELAPEQREEPEGQPGLQQTLPGADTYERKLEYKQSPRITPAEPLKPEPAEKKPSSELEIMARARRVLSERQTFAAYSQDKFNQYMRAAERYMQQGKYYLASDSYTLASIYKPMDPLAYAGKSHALFAAGEYLSSARYLSHAIEMFNGYVDFKIDIVTMIGGMDTVEKRIADIKTWIELSSAPELQFLLAYVYMQLDRLDKASEAINAAYKQMPDAPAVGLLKAAIEKRLNQ
jgi:hypothetical protein